MRHLHIVLCLFASLIMTEGLALAQDYPSKPIRVVAPGPGGQSDFVARLMGQEITGILGQQVIVDDRPAGIIPGDVVSKSAPDGYTLLVSGNNLWITPLIQKTPYDAVRDFLPIAIINGQPNILVVTSSLPVTSVKELIAYAKGHPGQLNYTSAATGSSSHLSAELFKNMAGVNIVRVAYKASTTEMADLISGQVQLTFGTPASVLPHVKSGKLRALAVTSTERSALFPDIPTISASGLPGYASGSIAILFAPAGTPANVVGILNRAVVTAVNKPDVKEKFFNYGIETIGSSPEQAAAKIKAEVEQLGKLVKDAGIHAE